MESFIRDDSARRELDEHSGGAMEDEKPSIRAKDTWNLQANPVKRTSLRRARATQGGPTKPSSKEDSDSRSKGRKRLAKEAKLLATQMEEPIGPRQRLDKNSRQFIGKHIWKEFKGHGVFKGQVKSVKAFASGLAYHVVYEDGDREDMVGSCPLPPWAARGVARAYASCAPADSATPRPAGLTPAVPFLPTGRRRAPHPGEDGRAKEMK